MGVNPGRLSPTQEAVCMLLADGWRLYESRKSRRLWVGGKAGSARMRSPVSRQTFDALRRRGLLRMDYSDPRKVRYALSEEGWKEAKT
jgi:hypothetical protein